MNDDMIPRLRQGGVISGASNLSDLGDALLAFQNCIVLFQDLVLGFETRYDRIATQGLKHLANDMADRYHHIMVTYHRIKR